MQDIFRHMHPRTKEFTFFRTNCAPSRLDRIYISHQHLQEVNQIQHVASLFDHCGVLLEMMFQNVVSSKTAMPIRSPIGDLGPLGDFLVKIGPPLVPYYTKSPLFKFLNLKKYLN